MRSLHLYSLLLIFSLAGCNNQKAEREDYAFVIQDSVVYAASSADLKEFGSSQYWINVGLKDFPHKDKYNNYVAFQFDTRDSLTKSFITGHGDLIDSLIQSGVENMPNYVYVGMVDSDVEMSYIYYSDYKGESFKGLEEKFLRNNIVMPFSVEIQIDAEWKNYQRLLKNIK